MKVIGKTDTGYLLEASAVEIAKVAGHEYVHSAPFASDHGRTIPSGTVLEVSPRFDRLAAIERAEAEVRKGATALRALADLAEKSIPSGITPPVQPEAAADV